MTGLIKHKLTVQTLVERICFFCLLPTAYCAEVGGFVAVIDPGLFGIDSGTKVMAAVSSSHGPVLPAGIRNGWTEVQR